MARITAFSPGQSPPPVSTPIRTYAAYSRLRHQIAATSGRPTQVATGFALRSRSGAAWWPLGPGEPVDQRLGVAEEGAGEDAAEEENGVNGPGDAQRVADHHHARAEDREEHHLHGRNPT